MEERRSSMSESDKQQILEQRRRAYQMRRTTKDDATNNEHRPGPSNAMGYMMSTLTSDFSRQVHPQDEQEDHATEASRKGKSVALDNQKHPRANRYIPGWNTLGSIVIGSIDGDGTNTMCNVMEQGILRRSPRFIEQVQCLEEHASEESRKRKGKSIVQYNKAPKQHRANICVPGRNMSKSIVIGPRDGENNNRDPMDYEISSDDGDHHEIGTSDDDVAVDDENQVSRSVRLRDHEAGTSTTSNATEVFILRRSPRLHEQPQRPKSTL
ncbi:uncharacterized protein LOC113343642 isoform X1 [Papaver somniferum]|uniref:uncharacterized protein LOC113343642 isoform X1 n=1 Tax=Papaver somniferum TaxID=3469 RepID=UPI000E705499|nr:uncharacterized protein LOC113343642 isoform X1 [Papaver somniferum]XP_026443547.1 uncharacterized protein LOC113343642 isoform X1 [Papaver somniferum]XP_026443548.1 uncharacterized protein LOC113343642 isoform X1 [Papaver somniferum]XP_026443549.1 uncharacterized protein LOC113343642 isoform X1 [Papaver somniferum]XP_026443550.1 uncharacterized protein LOC113343642 isoform X1 [Papaver somniferum]XP_026443551.1 uncharacterized protein LOC113343642 isoform X1 [Papaver somniferum]XP_02644355